MNRRDFVKASLLAPAVLQLQGLGACTVAKRKPNIVLLYSDDAGHADFSLNGNTLIPTPNIDSIAKQGVRFTQGYMTASVCSPSRAGLVTGRYQQRFGHEFNLGVNYTNTPDHLFGLPTEELTIADLLREEGYATGLMGKWHLGSGEWFHPNNRGFDEFFGMIEGSSTYQPGEAQRMRRNFEQADFHNLPYLTDALGDGACDFIENHRSEPFFLFLSFNAVHTPMHARPDYLQEFRGVFETEDKAINAAMTKSLDENVGKVLGKLEELGLEKDTIVIFTNDNGGPVEYNASSNDPFAGTKGTFLEGGIRVPFVMKWPGKIEPGSEYEYPVSALDILPTALRAAGGTLPGDREYDGVDLLPRVTGKETGRPHEVLFWRLWHHGAVRKGDWKLIWFDDQPPRLHNLAEDMGEQTDLREEHPEKVEELLADFHRWQETTIEPLFRTEPRWKEHSRRRYDQAWVDSVRKR